MEKSSLIKIEVPAKTILTWMGERGIVTHDWTTKLHQLHVCFAELRQNFPFSHEEEAVREVGRFIKQRESFFAQEATRSGLQFDYFEANEIFRRLTETTKEGSQKFLFGGFKSKIVEDWQTFLKQYDQDGLSFAEHAQNLQQALNFGQPAIRKEIGRLSTSIADGQQKQEILQSKIRAQEKKLKVDCDKLGVAYVSACEADQVKGQLRAQTSKVLSMLDEIATLSKGLDNCALYYQLLAGGSHSQSIDVRKELGVLRLFANYGDVTKSIYFTLRDGGGGITGNLNEFLKQTADTSLSVKEAHKYDYFLQEESKADDQWEILQNEQFKATDIGKSEVDISVNDSAAEDTLLQCPETRALLLDDLAELQCFLQQLLAELTMPESQLRCQPKSEDPVFINLRYECENQTNIKAKVKTIQEIRQKLEDQRFLQLIAIKQKPKTVEKLTQELIKQQKLKSRLEVCLNELESDLKTSRIELEAQKLSLFALEERIALVASQITQDLKKALKSADCRVII